MGRNFSLQWFVTISLLFVFNPHIGGFSVQTNISSGTSYSFSGWKELNNIFSGREKHKAFLSHPSDYFRSKNDGNWNDLTTWESSADQVNWEIATLFPTSAAKGINIRAHRVILSAHTTARTLTIETGGILTNSGPSGGYNLTIEDDGSEEPDFKIYGTYLLFGNQPIFNDNATAKVYEGGLVRVDENLGVAQSDNFASNDRVTFNTKSVFEWNVEKTFRTSGTVYFPNSANEIPVFRVSKDPGNVGAGLLTINGILDVNVNFTFIGGSNKIFRNGITGNSTLTQNTTNGNRFTISGNNAILGGDSLKIILSFPMYLTSSVVVPKDSRVTITGRNINNDVLLSVEGTLDVTDIQVSPNAITNVTGTGIYRTAHPGGFSGAGSSIPGGTVTLQPGATIELHRMGDQFLRIRPDISNVIFSGSGTKTASSGFDPIGTITIKDKAILDSRGQKIGNENTNLTMTDDSRLILNTVGSNPAIEGIYKLTGGVIQFDNNSGTKQTIRGTTSRPAGGTSVVYNQIEVTGSNVGNGAGNINLKEGGKFTVKSGGVFEINANAIKGVSENGNQQVIVESNAEFKTGNEHGFHGLESTSIPIGVSSIHPNITNVILEPNSTVNYHRSSLVQVSGLQTITTTVPYHHLTFSGNQEKTAQLNGIIEIKGDLNKTTEAEFIHNNSTVVFNGSAIQNYKSAYPQMVFNNLINENTFGLNIRDSLSIFRTLTLGNNSKLNINADITIQSNLHNTAEVAKIPENASIHYNSFNAFIIERYIPNHPKAWQFMATPVHGDQTIHQAWQEGMTPGMSKANNDSGAPGNTRPGYGTTITSDRQSWRADGFDFYTSSGPSLKTYNHMLKKWEGISSTDNPIQNSSGYMLFVRGDRSVITHDQSATATTLRTRGKIYAPGTFLPPTTAIPNIPGLFVSVGNPYASAINFENTDRTNLSDSYIIWDPQLTNNAVSQYGLGAYRTISNGVVVPASENYTDDNIPPIQQGQAFFVQLAENASGAGSISFTENAKTSGSRAVFRDGHTFQPDAYVRANLYLSAKENLVLLDGNITQFHPEFSASLDELDVIKMLNSGENLGILSHSKTLAIERKPLFRYTDTLFYVLSGLKKQRYELEIITSKTDISGMEIFLDDVYLNNQKLLDPSGKTTVQFEVNNDPASSNKNRFRIIFKSPMAPLTATITHFSAQQSGKEVLVKWQSENESHIEKYLVEKSTDGIQFYLMSEKIAENSPVNYYQIPDKTPVQGNNYYRLKIISKNEKVTFSDIVLVNIKIINSQWSLHSNPITNGIVEVQFSNFEQGVYNMRILNMNGQIISSKSIYYNGQRSMKLFDIKHAPPGIYSLEMQKPNGQKDLRKFVH